MVELLKDSKLRFEQEEYVGNALACLSRLNCLLTDIMDYSTVERGKLGLTGRLLHRYAFGQVPGLIYILSQVDGHFIGEQLYDRQHQKAFERPPEFGQHPRIFNLRCRSGCDQGDDAASPCLDFLQVGGNLLQQFIAQGHGKGWEVRINEGDGAMLHFAGGVSFSVDIGYFFELESPLQCQRVVLSSAEEEKAVGVRVLLT